MHSQKWRRGTRKWKHSHQHKSEATIRSFEQERVLVKRARKRKVTRIDPSRWWMYPVGNSMYFLKTELGYNYSATSCPDYLGAQLASALL